MIEEMDWFWHLVIIKDENECWEWIGKKNEKGYGLFWMNKDVVFAHRESYRREHGEPGELVVCHRCDFPSCVNPYHLFLGTVADNNLDKKAKGRDARGEQNAATKLTWEQVNEIRAKYEPYRYGFLKLGKEYGVDKRTIRAIIEGKTWTLP